MASATTTIASALQLATERLRPSGSETPRLDAEVLLAHVLRVDRASLLAHSGVELGPAQAAEFEGAISRRADGEPVAYIRGLKEFYGVAFAVDERVLIPRPETELLVDLALGWTARRLTSAPRPAGTAPLQLVDVGTGSGAIAVSLAVECRRRGYAAEMRILASDISADALAVARENGVAHGVADIVTFVESDLLDELPAELFGLVLANLPYVSSALIPQLPIAASYEPRAAFDGGVDGLDVVRRLLDQLPDRLADGGAAMLEIGSDQADAIRAEVERRLPGWSVEIHADLGGAPRVVELAAADAAR